MADDVPDEWVRAALEASRHTGTIDTITNVMAAIAAVAPLIRAEERKACAEIAKRAYAVCVCQAPAKIASAILARGRNALKEAWV